MTDPSISQQQSNLRKSSLSQEVYQVRQKNSQLTENFELFKSIINFQEEDDDLFKTCPYEEQLRISQKSKFLTFKERVSSQFQQSKLHKSSNMPLSPQVQPNVTNIFINYKYFKLSDEINPSRSYSKSPQTKHLQYDHSKMPDLNLQQIELKKSLLGEQLQESILFLEEEIAPKIESINQKQLRRASKSNVRLHLNRLAKVSMQQRNPQKVEKIGWTWDTSGALIRLMQRSQMTRVIMNLYIWVLMVLRTFYLFLMINYIVENYKDLPSYTYFWIVFGVYFGIRIMFALIVLKILLVETNDQKIKIVQETYYSVLKRFQREGELTSHKLWTLRCMMIVVPPEFSFIFLSPTQRNKISQSGYYQVQNLIMKSLEMFFFVPFVIIFLHNTFDITMDFYKFKNWNVYKITSIVLLVDIITFWVLSIFLLISNQKRLFNKQNKKINVL